MGWWRIDDIEKGGIGHKLPSGRPNGAMFLNAIPGRDNIDDLYGGDGPADAMDKAIKKIDAQFQQAWGRHAQPDEMRACFNFCFNAWIRRARNR